MGSIPSIISSAVVTLYLFWAVFAVFLLFRNQWVYRQRTHLLWDDWPLYQRLPSYNSMMWRFWVWDVRRFIAPVSK